MQAPIKELSNVVELDLKISQFFKQIFIIFKVLLRNKFVKYSNQVALITAPVVFLFSAYFRT